MSDKKYTEEDLIRREISLKQWEFEQQCGHREAQQQHWKVSQVIAGIALFQVVVFAAIKVYAGS